MEAIIVQNCTITGLSWSEYQRKKRKGGARLRTRVEASNSRDWNGGADSLLAWTELGKTQPFDDNLHQRVLKYQNDLFDAREINARERVDAPARTAQVKRAYSLTRSSPCSLARARFRTREC